MDIYLQDSRLGRAGVLSSVFKEPLCRGGIGLSLCCQQAALGQNGGSDRDKSPLGEDVPPVRAAPGWESCLPGDLAGMASIGKGLHRLNQLTSKASYTSRM